MRPFARRRRNTLRPPELAMRARKPCSRLRTFFLGWNVLFMWSSRMRYASEYSRRSASRRLGAPLRKVSHCATATNTWDGDPLAGFRRQTDAVLSGLDYIPLQNGLSSRGHRSRSGETWPRACRLALRQTDPRAPTVNRRSCLGRRHTVRQVAGLLTYPQVCICCG